MLCNKCGILVVYKKMPLIKKYIIVSIILLSTVLSHAQLFEISFDPVFRKSTGDIYSLALAGGLNQPQFSNIDLNKDGFQDLMVFDRTGNKILTFISTGGLNYRYDPSYEEFFPRGVEFVQLRDYDGDGLPDVFLYNGDSVVVYRNTTVSTPQFDSVRALKGLDKVSPVPFNPYKKLSQINGCLPAIVDIDGDEDFDYITNLNSIGSDLILNLNNSAERGAPLGDIDYEIIDKCYGGISEYSGELTINSPCYFPEVYKKKHSATKTLCFFDNDADGDLDLFYGSSEQSTNPVYYFENGKSDLAFYKDTFIRIDTAYFLQDDENQLAVAPAMSYVDVDNDGVKDLIMSSNERVKSAYPIKEANNAVLFLNKDATNNPDFQYNRNDFLVGDMIDFGGRTSPAFVDLDADGDMDLIVATSGDHFYTADTMDFLVYYENIGSVNNPDFKLQDNNYLNLKQYEYQGMVPTFADLDADGDQDMLIGMADGSLSYFVNNGDASNPVFQLQTDGFGAIQAGGYAAPVCYDLDNDGKLDLLLGSYEGTIRYYKNRGTTSAPVFTLEDDSLGGIVINELIHQSILGPKGFYDTLVYQYYGYSAPQVVSWTNGSTCLAVGGEQGLVRLFEINPNLSAVFEEKESYMHQSFTLNPYTKDWGVRVYPAAADLNNDGASDLLIGNLRGGVHYMAGKNPKVNSISDYLPNQEFNMAPNPSRNEVKFFTASKAELQYEIFNLNGLNIVSGSTLPGAFVSLGDQLVNGIYIVRLSNDEGLFTPKRLVIVE